MTNFDLFTSLGNLLRPPQLHFQDNLHEQGEPLKALPDPNPPPEPIEVIEAESEKISDFGAGDRDRVRKLVRNDRLLTIKE